MNNYFKQGEKTNKILKAKKKWTTGTGAWYEFFDYYKDDFVADKICYFDEDNGTIEIPLWLFELKFGKK